MNNKKNINGNGNSNGNGNGFVATIEPTNGNGNGHKKNKKTSEGVESLAVRLSAVMRDPGLPVPVKNSILDGLNTVFNDLHLSDDDPDFQDEDDTSAAYMENLLKRHAEKQVSDKTTEVYDAQAVEDNSYNPNSMVGLYLDEATTFDFIQPNSSLIWELKENDDTPQPTIVKETSSLRKDGRFTLEVVFPASLETIKSTPETPQETSMFGSKSEHAKPIADYVHKNDLSGLVHALINNADIPSRFLNTLYDSLNDMAGERLVIEVSREAISEALLRESVRGLQIKRQTEEIQDNNDCVVSMANKINDIFYNKSVPHRIVNCLADGIFQTSWDCGINNDVNISAEYVEEVIREYWSRRESGKPWEMWENKRAEQSKSATIEELDRLRLERITNDICHILDSEKVSDDTKDALESLLLAAANHAGMGIDFDTDILRVAFPKIIDSLNSIYAEGILDSIDGFADVFIGTEVGEELNQYAKRFESKTASVTSAADLNTDDTQLTKLAKCLSEILENPKTPEDLFNAVVGQLDLICGNELSEKLKSPEVIKQGLIHDQKQRERAQAA